ncbi:MAG: tRNA (adenosine(37)-N6)-threonylcarbamoyltransferase complex transferase subunit TsaD [Armatimonadetes bacterium]|nr:tRNA (adenosine(37)-N6)-threonylcarbamoyltransferase complex transferase subunit TsaD [Armatimonadota bacterium]
MFWDQPVLGIETSCDETAAAVVVGRQVLSNVIASQVDIHAKWGGVIPEVAARQHVESILPVIQEALTQARIVRPAAISVTDRPGLVGALSVGVSAAKALAKVWGIPMVGVHHLEGHLLSPWGDPDLRQEIDFPLLSLIVSGGHTELVMSGQPGEYQHLGGTIDDAAGEAFDKGARLLGLGYPGGKAIQNAAESGDPKRYDLPRALPDDPHNFSFSGLKTAVLRLVQIHGSNLNINDAAASLQAAIVDVLVKKTVATAELFNLKTVCLVGGVSANKPLRTQLDAECIRRGISLFVPPFDLCTDNAAMIALAGSFRINRGETTSFDVEPKPNAPLPGMIEAR